MEGTAADTLLCNGKLGMTRHGISRRRIVGLVLLGGAGRALPARAENPPDALTPVKQLVGALLQIMRAGRATPAEERSHMLSDVIDRVFDLPTILRQSVGPIWQSLTAAQRNRLLEVFRRYTIASYVNSFDNYDGQRFEVLQDTRGVGNGRQFVRTRIISPDGETHELDYVMQPNKREWKVVDVLADGSISRVAVQRSDFRRLLSRGGPAALIAQLQRKTADLSG
jgi:phospholipid transport system substrate-binding protein